MQAKFGSQMRQVKRVWMPAALLHSRKGLGHDFALPNVVRQRTVESHGTRKHLRLWKGIRLSPYMGVRQSPISVHRKSVGTFGFAFGAVPALLFNYKTVRCVTKRLTCCD
jgi:hypothetical protein